MDTEIFLQKFPEKWSLVRPRRRCENSTKIDLGDIGCEYGSGSGSCLMRGLWY